ncbi:MAG: HAMP domain-containing sensor histidine kinase [Methylovulum miyakonense]|uniref:sensor histidine kinase n=1 Tax=Methylovulum miyakonense TaxID=645578 RepID=UPI003BB6C731
MPLKRRLFRLRSILLLVMLTVLALPLGGLYFFRIYENELVQQTERELIAQAAVMSASVRQLVRNLHKDKPAYGVLLATLPPPAYPYEPIVPTLSLINPIQPPRPDAQFPSLAADDLARKVGELMQPVMRDTQHFMLSGLRLLDVNGVVIAGREDVGLTFASVLEVQQALQGQYASTIRQRLSDEPPPPLYSMSRGTNIRVFVAFPIIETVQLTNRPPVEQRYLQGVVYLSRTPNNILKHLFAAKGTVVIVSLCLLLLVVLLVMLVSASIARPIRELIRQTERVKQGEQKQLEPLKNPVTYEIAQLSASFAEMSQALIERSDYIQRFATHVSHEFKTPLTSMQGALELLQDHTDTMPAADQQRFVSNLLADTQRLKQLVNRLLELARADALEPSRQQCLLANVIASLHNRFQERGLMVHVDNLPDMPLAIAPDALEMVLSNLLENSLQHGASDLAITAQRQGPVLTVNLQDNGSGISPANRNKIFTPFFTTRRNSGGTGLGLQISLSLLKAYNGEMALAESTQGALFVLTLPLALMSTKPA